LWGHHGIQIRGWDHLRQQLQGQFCLLVGNQAHALGNVAVKQRLKKHVLYLKFLALESLRRFLQVQHAGNGWVLQELAQDFINLNAQ